MKNNRFSSYFNFKLSNLIYEREAKTRGGIPMFYVALSLIRSQIKVLKYLLNQRYFHYKYIDSLL